MIGSKGAILSGKNWGEKMGASYGVAFIGLLGAAIGAASSLGGQLVIWRLDKRAKLEAVAGAIAAEIDGYLSLMGRRDHETAAKHLADQARAGIKISFKAFLTEPEIASDPFPIIRSQFTNIGLLGPLAGDVTRFYALVTGVRSTVIANIEGRHDHLTADQMANLIEGELRIWNEALALGRTLARQLKRYTG
jgi:hypothetical protein